MDDTVITVSISDDQTLEIVTSHSQVCFAAIATTLH